MSAPRISVCIPTFNGAPYLRECIQSVLLQSYRDFELVIVDDCSTDGTVEIVRELCAQDERIRFLQNETTRGLVGNWNRCVELANGEWVKFVFQDDAIEARCLERMIAAAGDSVALIACRRKLVFAADTTDSTRSFYLEHEAKRDRLLAGASRISAAACQELALRNVGFNTFGEPTVTMVHRSSFQAFGSFNPDLVMMCDHEYWTRVSIHVGAVYIPEVLASFRVHGASTSARNFAQRKYRMDVLDKLILLRAYLHDVHYEPIRKAAEALSPAVLLTRLFDTQRYVAYCRASAALRQTKDDSLMREYRMVCLRYPEMAISLALWGKHLLRSWYYAIANRSDRATTVA